MMVGQRVSFLRVSRGSTRALGEDVVNRERKRNSVLSDVDVFRYRCRKFVDAGGYPGPHSIGLDQDIRIICVTQDKLITSQGFSLVQGRIRQAYKFFDGKRPVGGHAIRNTHAAGEYRTHGGSGMRDL